jgi:branched-chain amino acid transport system substrate-binding protein
MKPTFALIAVALFSAVGVSAEEKDPYDVVAILPLSGQVASLGNYVKNGIDLAIEQLPERERSLIRVHYEDDQFAAEKTLSAYRKSLQTGRLDAVFVLGSTPGNALAPVVERDKKILLAIGASDPTIVSGREYSFIHWVIPPVLGEALSTELLKRKFERIAILSAEQSGALADVDALTESLAKAGRSDSIVVRKDVAPTETDYRTFLALATQKKSEAIVAVLFPGALSSFARQFRASGLKAELVGMESFEDEGELKASGGALAGGWYVNAADSSSEFVDRYKEKYGSHPGWGSANGYDSLNLIAKAVTEKGDRSDNVRSFLKSLKDYSGACGTYSASGDNRFTLPAQLKMVTANGFEPLR